MPLKYKVENLDGVDEAIKPLYTKKTDGGKEIFILDVDGVVESTKLDEFRTNNKALHKQIADLSSKFDGVDPEDYRALREAVGGLKADELPEIVKKAKDVEKIVDTRTQAMRKEHDSVVNVLKSDRDRIQKQLSELAINQTTIQIASKLGLRPTAHVDITTRARQIFSLDPKGNAVAKLRNRRAARTSSSHWTT